MTVLGRRAEPMLGGIMICQYAVNAAIDDAVCKHGGRMAVRRSLFEQCQGTRRIAGPAGAGQDHLAERDLSAHHADLGRARDPSAPFRDIAVNASSLDQDAAIPSSIKDSNVPGFGHLSPETPEVMVSFFNVIGGRDRHHFVSSRIEVFRQPTNISSFAGRIPSFVGDDYRNPAQVDLML